MDAGVVNLLVIGIVILGAVIVFMGVCIVPQQQAYVIERLGKYHTTLHAGISYIFPFMDRIAYKHTLKEQTIDIPEQVCITRDNVQVGVDGVVFMQVFEPNMASYGICNYKISIIQLAQTAAVTAFDAVGLGLGEFSIFNRLVNSRVDRGDEG